MKRSLSFILVLFSLSLNAQVDFSLKIGVNYNSTEYNFDEASEIYDPLIAGHFGLNVDLKFSDMSYLRTGLLYNVKGEQVKLNLFGEELNSKNFLHYVDIPLHYLHYLQGNDSGFFMELGPGLGYFFGQTLVDSESDEENDLYEFLEFNVFGGLGFRKDKYSLSAFYQRSLNDINDRNSSGIPESIEIRNVNIGVSFSYFFNVNKAKEVE